MSAAPHLLQRWGRWWSVLLLRHRVTQLAALVEQYEQEIRRTHDELASLQMELTRQRYQLRFATEHRPPARQPETWGL